MTPCLVPLNHGPKAYKVLVSFYSNIFEIPHGDKKSLHNTKNEDILKWKTSFFVL